MNKTSADIEVFTSSFCRRCQRACRMVKQLLAETGFENVSWREVDVLAEIDHAVALGVLATPAIAVGTERVFTALPSKQQLRKAIQYHLASGGSDDV